VRHKISTHMFKTRFISRYFIILCSRKCCRGIRRTASSSIAADAESDHTLYTCTLLYNIYIYTCSRLSSASLLALRAHTQRVCVEKFLATCALIQPPPQQPALCIFICVRALSAIYIVRDRDLEQMRGERAAYITWCCRSPHRDFINDNNWHPLPQMKNGLEITLNGFWTSIGFYIDMSRWCFKSGSCRKNCLDPFSANGLKIRAYGAEIF